MTGISPYAARIAACAIAFMVLILCVITLVMPANPAKAQSTAELTYTVRIDGLTDIEPGQADEMRQLIIDTILLEQLREQGAPSIFALERRAQSDLDRVQDVLRSRGYYAGSAAARVEPENGHNDTAVEPVAIITVEAGPRYTIGSIVLEQPDGTALPMLEPGILPLTVGDVALSAEILAAEPVAVGALRGQGYALARADRRRVTVNHEARQLTVRYRYIPGPLVTLGDITVNGLDTVAPIAVLRRVPFEIGAVYSPQKINNARSKIQGLEMFSSVSVSLMNLDQVPPDAQTIELPIQITVEERKLRTIGGAVALSTDEGLGVEARWAHRNILGEAERLEIIASVGRIGAPDAQGIDYGIESDFRKYDFLRNDQTLRLNAKALVEAPEAFERQAIELSAALERPLFEDVTGSTGVGLAIENIKDSNDADGELFVSLSLPNTLSLDKTDDLLDPTEGYAIDLLLEPVLTLTDASAPYFISRADARYFVSPWDSNVVVLATRASLGSIIGAQTDDIPANRRFYSGGDGSVRGYAHQSVGPKNTDNDPSGGRSLAEIAAEIRIRMTDTIGVVPFVDVGIVTEDSFPDFSEDVRVGAGIGLRYFTGFGPLRVDVGVPVNPDDDDNAFEIYFSLGQAF